MKFICEFYDLKKRKAPVQIPVTLTADDVAELERIYDRQKECIARNLPVITDADMVAMAMALHHAYRLAPAGFQHVNGGVHRAH
jgi:hypothetical protein